MDKALHSATSNCVCVDFPFSHLNTWSSAMKYTGILSIYSTRTNCQQLWFSQFEYITHNVHEKSSSWFYWWCLFLSLYLCIRSLYTRTLPWPAKCSPPDMDTQMQSYRMKLKINLKIHRIHRHHRCRTFLTSQTALWLANSILMIFVASNVRCVEGKVARRWGESGRG